MNTINYKFTSKQKALSLAIAALLASPLALGADEGWYLGGSVGQTQGDLHFTSAHLSALPAGVTIANSTYDDTDVGFKLFGGYQLNTNFAIEAGLFDLGEFGFSANTNPAGTNVGSLEVDGWYLDLVGTIPLTDRLDFLARAGLNYADTVTHMRGTGAVPASGPTDRGSHPNPKLGIGLQYALNDNFDLRLEVERYHFDEPVMNKGDIDLISLGLVYRFGNKPVARSATPPAPAAPVARVTPPAAAPAPAPTTPPPPPAPVRVVFNADSLFDFDQSTVKDAGKPELDRFIANLNGTTFDVITVTGHTDRIGNRDYNLALSQRRADAVKNYLVQTGRLPAAKIRSVGVNGSNSLIGANECRGTQSRAAQIACLQPDRRVVVEVTATR